MEGAPDFEGLEAMPQPDLLEAFADQEVTMFGFTGTFKDLADMCPVDLNDPRVTLEAKNEFVIKAANEAGLEIKAEHEELFTTVTERLGLERKFTIATPTSVTQESGPSTSTRVAREEPAKAQTTHETRNESAVPPKPSAEKSVISDQAEATPRHPRPAIPEDITVTTAEVPGTTDRALTTTERLRDSIILPEPIRSETHDAVVHDLLLRLPNFLPPHHEAESQPDDQQRQGVQAEIDDAPVHDYTTAVDESGEFNFDIEALLAEIEAEAAPAPEAIDRLLTSTQIESELGWASEPSVLPVSTKAEGASEFYEPHAQDDSEAIATVIEWEDELRKEPLEIYEDFAEALRSFAELPATRTAADENDALLTDLQPDDSEAKVKTVEASPLPVTVSERLAELQPDEKELAAPILKDIVGAIHGIQLLETQAADPEVIGSVETQLETLCIALFETIGVEYDKQGVEQFVRILLHEDFKPPQPTSQAIVDLDLEHMGTHEIKRHFSYLLTNGLLDVEYELEQLLGMFALFRISTGPSRELALAA